MSEEGFRSFIAVEIAEQKVLNRLLELGKALTGTGASIRLVEMKNLHVTLRFLGNVPRSTLDEVCDALDEVEFQPFNVELRGVGVFPSMSRVNVVWVGIEEGSVELLSIFRRLEERLRRIGFKPDRRGFVPHITVARVSSGRNRDALVKAVSELRSMEFGVFGVNSIKLKKSVLTPRGPIYSTLHEASAQQASGGENRLG